MPVSLLLPDNPSGEDFVDDTGDEGFEEIEESRDSILDRTLVLS